MATPCTPSYRVNVRSIFSAHAAQSSPPRSMLRSCVFNGSFIVFNYTSKNAYNKLMKNIVLAITGASGAPLGVRVLKELLMTATVHLIISSNTFPIIADETGLEWAGGTEAKIRKHFASDNLFFYEDRQMEAPIASGSFQTDGMLVVPCSKIGRAHV